MTTISSTNSTSATEPQFTDLGPLPGRPAWAAGQTRPPFERIGDIDSRTWDRDVDAGAVWIACTERIVDDHLMRSETRVHVEETPQVGLTAAAARRLAAELTAAAELIDAEATR